MRSRMSHDQLSKFLAKEHGIVMTASSLKNLLKPKNSFFSDAFDQVKQQLQAAATKEEVEESNFIVGAEELELAGLVPMGFFTEEDELADLDEDDRIALEAMKTKPPPLKKAKVMRTPFKTMPSSTKKTIRGGSGGSLGSNALLQRLIEVAVDIGSKVDALLDQKAIVEVKAEPEEEEDEDEMFSS
eukprot:TRINITY_DN527507_c0_g2_i1.p1 TRINITY_DN527507_c0_g2~~TRINITY_DN527507_c0_g2_i1.p1  ORF type:complete len:186 (+),score=63.63 TRINITY_DN527507_c0_g2_i1:190-747(+)